MEASGLCYGDTVFFKSLIHNGVFACKKRKVCMAVIQQLVAEASDTPPNLVDSCFVVYPKLAYSHVQRQLKHEKIHQATPEDDWPPKIERTIGRYRQLAKVEKHKNAALLGKFQGAPAPLGSTIMLYHVKSNSFLTMVKESADADKNALKLVLAEDGSKGAWFDMLPGFKTTRLGDNVVWGSSVSLRNTKNDVTLSISDHLDSGMAPPHKYCEKVIEVNCFVNPAVLAIYPYKQPSKQEFDLTLSSGDIISLYHMETDSNLVCRDGRSLSCLPTWQ